MASRGLRLPMDEAIRRWTEAMRARDYARAYAIGDAVMAARDPGTRDDASLPYHRRWLWDGQPLDLSLIHI